MSERESRIAEARSLRGQGWTWKRIGEHFGRDPSSVREWIRRADAREAKAKMPPADTRERVEFSDNGDTADAAATGVSIQTLDQLLDAASVDRSLWQVSSWRANVWETNTGAGEKMPLWQVKANLERIPEWVRLGAQPRRRMVRKGSAAAAANTALILPDVQFGFRWDFDARELAPLHDERACALAVEVAKRLQPGIIVQVGDLLDLAPFGKYSLPPELRMTSQPSLQAAHDWLAELRAACPAARMHVIEGNHELRITKTLTDAVPEAVSLRPVGHERAAMSVPHLLGLDAIDVEYREGYPAADVWLWGDRVRVTHGEKVRQGGGSTVAALLKEAQHSTVYGHIHRREWAARTVHGPKGTVELFAGSPGTLSRIDGAVPGSSRPDWQQGLAALHLHNGRVSVESWPIVDGELMWRGELLRAA